MPEDKIVIDRQKFHHRVRVILTAVFCFAALMFFFTGRAAGFGTAFGRFALVMLAVSLCLALGWWWGQPKIQAAGARRRAARQDTVGHRD